MSQRRVSVVVSGSVQGVFFRSSTQEEAERLGLSGWVRNRADGDVEAEFQGPPDTIERIIRFCREGPSSADVTKVDVHDLEAVEGAAGFEVR